jgi:hypothetical protein
VVGPAVLRLIGQEQHSVAGIWMPLIEANRIHTSVSGELAVISPFASRAPGMPSAS